MFLFAGNPPVLLLPDNVRIRRFNLSSEQYSDYLDHAEHIQALDYLWDPQEEGLSTVTLPSLNIIMFTFRAFSRRFYPIDFHQVLLSERETTIYGCQCMCDSVTVRMFIEPSAKHKQLLG